MNNRPASKARAKPGQLNLFNMSIDYDEDKMYKVYISNYVIFIRRVGPIKFGLKHLFITSHST